MSLPPHPRAVCIDSCRVPSGVNRVHVAVNRFNRRRGYARQTCPRLGSTSIKPENRLGYGVTQGAQTGRNSSDRRPARQTAYASGECHTAREQPEKLRPVPVAVAAAANAARYKRPARRTSSCVAYRARIATQCRKQFDLCQRPRRVVPPGVSRILVRQTPSARPAPTAKSEKHCQASGTINCDRAFFIPRSLSKLSGFRFDAS